MVAENPGEPLSTPIDRAIVIERLRRDPTATFTGLVSLNFGEIMDGRYNQQHALLQELARRFASELGDYMSYVEVKPVSVGDDGTLSAQTRG